MQFKPRKFSITIDDPDEAENFLRGLIVAKSNNSSPLFEDLINAVNGIMEDYRAGVMKETMAAREAAGM